MRLFAALRPPEHVLGHLRLALEAVEPRGLGNGPPPLRWTPVSQWHITLAFYGEIPDGALPELAAALAEVAHAGNPLDLELTGAGSFHGQTLWAGVHDTSAAGRARGLIELMAACEQAGAGISPEQPRDRRRAHLTLARISSRNHHDRRAARMQRRQRAGKPARQRRNEPPAVDMSAIVRALAVYRGPVWRATEIELLTSQLGGGPSGGARHEVVARLPLGATIQQPARGRG